MNEPLTVEQVTKAWTDAGALTNGRTDFLVELTRELNAARALTGPGEREDRCGNCQHTKDDHSSRGREICGIPWCQCPGYLTSDPTQPDELQRLTEALRTIYGEAEASAYHRDYLAAIVAIHAEAAAALRVEPEPPR